MNEKIKELAVQADPDYTGIVDEDMGHAIVGNDAIQKFAELIIKEVLSVMDKTAKDAKENFTYMGDDVPTSSHQISIKDHFGMLK